MLELAVFWCVVRGASTTRMYLCVVVQEDMAGEWRNSTMFPTPLVAPGARHSENVRESKACSIVLFLSCFIGF